MDVARRLLVHVEGHTEKDFVDSVLAPHLHEAGYERVGARLLGNARAHNHSGGIRPWPFVRDQILSGLLDDKESVATTMVDFYGLTHKDGWVVKENSSSNIEHADKRVQKIQDDMRSSIAKELGVHETDRRFIPFIVLHEFEGLLFSDCNILADTITQNPKDRRKLASKLIAIRTKAGGNPEQINEHPNTAPSRQLQDLVPDYQKPLFGTIAALDLGLGVICRECPHFAGWLGRLEQLISSP